MTQKYISFLVDPRTAVRTRKISEEYWKVVAMFETGEYALDWSYIEDLGDGRGYTFTWAGMTDEDRAGLSRYALTPSLSAKFMLKGKQFRDWWITKGCKLEAAQQTILKYINIFYGEPAIQVFSAHGCVHAITLAFLLDTVIQHGAGDDPDSLDAIVRAVPWTKHVSEYVWLLSLIAKRRSVLLNPANKATAAVWRESVDRVEYFESWAKSVMGGLN
jgi:chitosanase